MALPPNSSRGGTGLAVETVLGVWESVRMKTTLEINDELYPEAKSFAAATGRKMKDLVCEGLRLALQPVAPTATKASAAKKLAACFAGADEAMMDAPRTLTARAHLSKGRNRFEKALLG